MDYRSDNRKCQGYECFTSLSVSYFGYIMEVSSIGRGYWSTLRKPTSMSQVHQCSHKYIPQCAGIKLTASVVNL